MLQPVRDQVLDGDQLEAVLVRELAQARQPHHRAVVVHDLADHAARIEPGEPREVDRGFGLSGAHEHAAFARAQRKGVARAQEVGRRRVGIEQREDRVGAIVRRDPGRDAAARFDRDRERGPQRRGVVGDHVRDLQLVEPRSRAAKRRSGRRLPCA